MTYAETLDYLYNALPMFSRMGSAAYRKDLTNIRTLCERLGNPQNSFKSVHVGGTNGKGSVSHMLAAILQTAGYKTGLHTSPHLYDFRERIRLNGKMVPKNFVVRFTERIKSLAEEIQPSFFEITVAMAFQYFAEQTVDVAVIEVGLGGRLDSTNIIRPELAVITNIGWDHMNLLGDSLEKIAAEKAGIIKPNVPVVIGETLPETEPVFEFVAKGKNALLHLAGETYTPISHEWTHNSLQVTLKKRNGDTVNLQADLPGIYQIKNLCTVLTAVDALKAQGWQLEEQTVSAALRQVKKLTGLHGRWEVIRREPRVVLEVAHNKEGIAQMLQHLAVLSFAELHVVLGTVKDKDAKALLALLPAAAKYYFTQATIPRALPANELQAMAAAKNLLGEVYENVNAALQEALDKASKKDLIVVCGSIFLVAEVDRRRFESGA